MEPSAKTRGDQGIPHGRIYGLWWEFKNWNDRKSEQMPFLLETRKDH
jgi:hypothetical protein